MASVTGATKSSTASAATAGSAAPAARPRPTARRSAPVEASVGAPQTPVSGAAPPSSIPHSEHAGSILRQLETRPVSSWIAAQTHLDEIPEPPDPAIPGAYLAPSAAFTAPLIRPRPGRPAEPLTPARPSVPAYATSATGAAAPVAFAPTFGSPAAAAQLASPAGKRVGVSMQAPAELPGWLAIAGSAIASVSFLMPWSRDGVIGAAGSGYFDRWGLANAGYLPLVIAALALLAINGVPNPVPSWIRAGLLPVAIGGTLFGLDWAYQTRPYSDGLGVTLLLIAALVLMAGGIVGVRSGRHPAAPPLV